MPERKIVVATTLVAAAAIMAVGAGAIYLSRDQQSNQSAGTSAAPQLAEVGVATAPADPSCELAVEHAARLDPHAAGQVAAFRVASRPVSMAGLDFSLPDGTPIALADFAGRTLLVNFWATWCIPCRAEMPAIDELAGHFGDRDFEVVAISLDRAEADTPRAFLDEIGIRNLELYVDPRMSVLSDIRSAGAMGGLPTTMIVDETGCLLGLMEGPAEWNSPEAYALIEAALAP